MGKQVLKSVAQGILLHVYQLVVLTVWQTGPLGVELPHSVGADLLGTDLLQHDAAGVTQCPNHMARRVVKAVFVNLSIEPVDGFLTAALSSSRWTRLCQMVFLLLVLLLTIM